MAESRYTILVKAVIDPADLQTQLNKVQQTMMQGSTGKKLTLIDENSNNVAIQSVRAAFMSLKTDMAEISKIRVFQNEEGVATRGIVDYKNQLGLVKTATFEVREGVEGWVLAQSTATQNIDKSRIAYEKYARMQETAAAQNAEFDKKAQATKMGIIQQEAKWQDTQITNEKKKATAIQDNYAKQVQNLETLKIKNADAFKSGGVQQQLAITEASLQQYRAGTIRSQEYDLALRNLNNTVQQYNQSTMSANKQGYNFVSMMEIAIKKILLWGAGTMLIYGSMRKISEGIQYIKDLNKELTNIAVVTGMNAAQTGALTSQYTDLAIALGTTTLEVAKGSLEWFN